MKNKEFFWKERSIEALKKPLPLENIFPLALSSNPNLASSFALENKPIEGSMEISVVIFSSLNEKLVDCAVDSYADDVSIKGNIKNISLSDEKPILNIMHVEISVMSVEILELSIGK